jgi:hypothetical protein
VLPLVQQALFVESKFCRGNEGVFGPSVALHVGTLVVSDCDLQVPGRHRQELELLHKDTVVFPELTPIGIFAAHVDGEIVCGELIPKSIEFKEHLFGFN